MQSDDGTASVYHFMHRLRDVFCKSKSHIGSLFGLGGMILLRSDLGTVRLRYEGSISQIANFWTPNQNQNHVKCNLARCRKCRAHGLIMWS